MRKMTLTFIVALTMLFAFSISFGAFGDLSVYQSLSAAGTTMGGLRIDLDNSMVTDLSITSTGSTYSYWADLYYGLYGIAITGDQAKALRTISLMFAAEASISDGVALGIAFPLIAWTDGVNNLAFIGSWDTYAVIAF